MDEQGIYNIIQLDDVEQHATMKRLYRRFTDQVMGTMAALGAP